MLALTTDHIKKIQEILSIRERISNTEERQALKYVKDLVANQSAVLGDQLISFYAIRSPVSTGLGCTAISTLRDYIFQLCPLGLPISEQTIEKKTISAMLKEIFTHIENDEKMNKQCHTKDTEENRGQELEDQNPTQPQFYELTKDIETALTNLYKFVARKDVTKQYVYGYPLIHVTIAHGRNEFLKTLLIESTIKQLETCLDDNKDNPLHCAARHGNAMAVSLLLGKGLDVNAVRGNRQLTALMLAIDQDTEQKETVEALLNSATINIELKRSWAIGSPDNAWDMALSRSHKKITALLLPHKVDFWNLIIDGKSAQHWAVANSAENVIIALIEKNQLDEDEEYLTDESKDWINRDQTKHLGSIIFVIAKEGYVNAYKLLKNKNLEKKNQYSQSPLEVAIIYDKKEIADLFIADGAELLATNSHNETILHFAARRAWLNLAEKIIELNADINKVDSCMLSALHTAVYNIDQRDKNSANRIAIVRLLLKHSSPLNINRKTSKGTLIEMATHKSAPGVLAVLIKDERVDVSDIECFRSLSQIAVKNKWQSVIEALEQRSAFIAPDSSSIEPAVRKHKKTYFELEVEVVQHLDEISRLKKQIANMMDTPTRGVLFAYSEVHKVREVMNDPEDKNVLATFMTSFI